MEKAKMGNGVENLLIYSFFMNKRAHFRNKLIVAVWDTGNNKFLSKSGGCSINVIVNYYKINQSLF